MAPQFPTFRPFPVRPPATFPPMFGLEILRAKHDGAAEGSSVTASILSLMLAPDGCRPEPQLPTELLAALWRAAHEEADHREHSSMIPAEYAMWLLENEAHIVYNAQSAGLVVCTCDENP